jgi:hypothetical protein
MVGPSGGQVEQCDEMNRHRMAKHEAGQKFLMRVKKRTAGTFGREPVLSGHFVDVSARQQEEAMAKWLEEHIGSITKKYLQPEPPKRL